MMVLGAQIAPAAGTAPLMKDAHRAIFSYQSRPQYLYVRSRAISSRTHDNHDTFPAAEIKAAYQTFVGKRVFVNHNNDNHRRLVGSSWLPRCTKTCCLLEPPTLGPKC